MAVKNDSQLIDQSFSLEGCLESWDLSELVPLFESSKIDEELFKDLTDSQIQELLPSSVPLGTRWKLSKNLKLLKEKRNTDSVPAVVSSSSIPVSTISTKRLLLSSGTKKEIEELDLEFYLENLHDGKCLLRVYKKNSCFTDDERSLLVEILAKFILFHSTQPTKEDFLTLQEKILDLFTSEDRIYYIPPKEEGEHQRLARGKLFDKVRNLKEWMRCKGLLPRSRDKKKDLSAVSVELTVPGFDEVKSLDWLKYNREPWSEVEKHWVLTYKYRADELKRSSELQEYISTYKVLTQSLGYTLIQSDFKNIFPDKVDSLFSNWGEFRSKILRILKEAKKDPYILKLKEMLNDEPGEGVIDAAVLQSLPSLIPPNRKIKLGNVLKKPSIAESRESFILHVKTPTDLEPALETRRKQVSAYGIGATIQPHIATVGETCTNITAIYVCINNIVYKCSSLLSGLDICFKSFYALDLEYPAESEQVWLTIQKGLYGITLPKKDKKIYNVNTFLSKLTRMSSDANIIQHSSNDGFV